MSDKEHFDKMLLKELAWKLDREVWAHVQNPSPSEEWSTSKAREETRKLCAEYLGNLDEVKAQLSSKEQELKDSALLYQNVVNTLQTKQQECDSLKVEKKDLTAFIEKLVYEEPYKTIESLRKRCEDLEAERDELKSLLKKTISSLI